MNDYNDVLCDPERGSEVVGILLDTLMSANRDGLSCRFENLPEGSMFRRYAGSLPSGIRRYLRPFEGDICPAVDLRTNRRKQYAKFWPKKVPAGMKRSSRGWDLFNWSISKTRPRL